MNDDDRWIKCVDCGEDFLFTAGEQAFYASKGLGNAPTRCKKCREARKAQRAEGGSAPRSAARAGGSREMHTTVCSACGAETQVPFIPVVNRPVYCRDCYSSHRPAREGAGAARGGAGRPAPKPTLVEGAEHGRGEVKWFNESKGFGFIKGDGGEEFFVHFSAILGDGFRTLAQGDRVEFDVVMGPKGRQAMNVVRTG